MLTKDQRKIIINELKEFEVLMIQGRKSQANGLKSDLQEWYVSQVEQTPENAKEFNEIYSDIKMNKI